MVRKYRILDTVQANIDIIDHKVQEVIKLFKPLVSKGDSFLLGGNVAFVDSGRVYGEIDPL